MSPPDPGHEKDKSRALRETGNREVFSGEFLGFLALFVLVGMKPIKKGPVFLRLKHLRDFYDVWGSEVRTLRTYFYHIESSKQKH